MNKQQILNELETAIIDNNVLELIADRIYNIIEPEPEPKAPDR